MLRTKSCTQPADKRPGCGPLRQVVVAKSFVGLCVLKRVVYCFLLITMSLVKGIYALYSDESCT